MANPNPFDFDVSVAADKKRRQRGKRRSTGAVETSTRICEHKGCRSEGKFKAPKSPDILDDFFWFCHKHVGEYNSKWDYYKAQSNEEIEQNQNARRSKSNEQVAWSRLGIEDPVEILGSKGTLRSPDGAVSRRRLTKNEQRALDILDAGGDWTKDQIRQQYKVLVKHLHPDMNEGDRTDEHRLKQVVWAWGQIKSNRKF